MIPKKKICKANNKAKGFTGCGKLKYIYRFGLCTNCFYSWLQCTEKGSEYIKKYIIPKAKNSITQQRKEKKQKMRVVSTKWKNKLQIEVNHIARLIDKGLPCLAKNIPCKQTHGGHVYSQGGHSNIRFHLDNIHRQSSHSNKWQNDDGLMREGLMEEYGTKYYYFIKGLTKMPQVKWSNEDYHQFTIEARKIVRELKQADRIYSKQERLDLRQELNLRLGIYDEKYCKRIV